ncbi:MULTISPECIES: phage protease [Nitrosomonas]|uniref:Phage I-like protein n=1 Tax=Nitrosomonas communis TaxID=44574 RepID=A0A5D3YCV1_9PROT|nr:MULTISPECIES: phage protease [Nitrosomonas]TYP84728.1 phage I-like protein [Nitrosomonas communis]UVS62505.1 phage protease [Nitrosomonas sp. PLL12]
MNRKQPQKTNPSLGIATCAFAVTPAKEVQLLPAGQFRTIDGRPFDAPHWSIDATLAASIIAEFESRINRTVVDYEHQTLLSAQNGQPAPAAGWFGKLEWRESGLFAVDVEWTERASQMIEAGEYRYISPVFTYDKKTGAIKRLLNAALTNNPALDGMDAVAASQFLSIGGEDMQLEQLLGALRKLTGQNETADADSVLASLTTLLSSKDDAIAALRTAADHPDPAKFVSIEVMKSLQNEVTTLKAEQIEREVDDVVEVALSEGKLLPAQEDWARKLGKESLESLKQYLAAAQPIAALTKTQTGGKAPDSGELDLNDANAIAAAANKYVSEQAALGITVTASQAVAYVTK